MRFHVAVLVAIFLLAGCSSAPRTISGVTPTREIAQVVYRPYSAQQAEPILLAWPAHGTVASRFGDYKGDFRNKGIDIRGREGDVVYAAAAGRVVYCDTKMRGLGMTIIIDHAGPYQTVYSHNDDILVKVGDTVRQREPIACIGKTGRIRTASLHFELRRDGEPVDPLAYLR